MGDLGDEDLSRLRKLMCDFRANPIPPRPALSESTVLCWSTPASPPTVAGFETAVGWLGGKSVVVNPEELSEVRVGAIENAGRVLSTLGNLLVVGGLADTDLERLAAAATASVVNAFSEGHDPCQTLALLAELEDHFGMLAGIRMAYVGDPCNVSHDLMQVAAMTGIELIVATPERRQPSPVVTVQARDVASRHGTEPALTHDPVEAVHGARAVIAGPRPAGRRGAASAQYEVTAELMHHAHPDAVVLGCAHAGAAKPAVEMPVSGVIGERAETLSESRLCADQAVLYALVEGLLTGSGGPTVCAGTTIAVKPLGPDHGG